MPDPEPCLGGCIQMESLETIGRKDVVRDNVRNPPAFFLGIIRRTAERMAGAAPAASGGPGGAPPVRQAMHSPWF